ncbi:MAG: CYTH domain-containing protein [Candidatus Micrarchaeales archaeon]
MAKELEMKITDIDKKEVLSRLKKLGAKYVGTYNFKRIIAFPNKVDKKYEGWFRVRTDGKEHVITFKQRKRGTELEFMDKYQVVVDSLNDAIEILKRFSENILYFENNRIQYMFEGVKVTVDKWPYLPWSLELEGDTARQILACFKKLNVKGSIVGNASGGEGYKIYGLDYEKVGKEKIHMLKDMASKKVVAQWIEKVDNNEIAKNLGKLNAAIKGNVK